MLVKYFSLSVKPVTWQLIKLASFDKAGYNDYEYKSLLVLSTADMVVFLAAKRHRGRSSV